MAGEDVVSTLDPAGRDQIRRSLANILTSAGFASATRRSALLRYLVDRATSDATSVNEYAIGIDVFERPPSFDPRTESIVRTEIGRLRQKLKEYYDGAGANDPLLIEIPLRSYIPSFTIRGAPVAEPELHLGSPTRWRLLWPAVAGIVIVTAIAAGALWRSRVTPTNRIHSLVVLPFQNLSADRTNEYLADGFTEELTNQLAQWQDVRVVARTSAFLFKGKGLDIREIGKQLNADAAVEGSVEKHGEQIRITAQLNRTSDGYHLWSKAYEGRADDILSIENTISQAITEVVQKSGSDIRGPRIPVTTGNAQARDLYMRAMFVLAGKKGDYLTRGRALLEQAVAIDPKYPAAWVQIADVDFALLASGSVAQEAGHRDLRNALSSALAADPQCADARGMLAALTHSYDWDWPRAEREFRTALADGGGPMVHSLYGWSLTTQGRFSEAAKHLHLAQDADPLPTGAQMNEVTLLYEQRKFDDAKERLRRILAAHPDLRSAHIRMGMIAIVTHDCAQVQIQNEWSARQPGSDPTLDAAALSLCQNNPRPIQEYLAKIPRAALAVDPLGAAAVFALAGDRAQALTYLEQAADQKVSGILQLKYDPTYDALRSEPRFITIEKKVGIEP